MIYVTSPFDSSRDNTYVPMIIKPDPVNRNRNFKEGDFYSNTDVKINLPFLLIINVLSRLILSSHLKGS